jgi:hypothetical protein
MRRPLEPQSHRSKFERWLDTGAWIRFHIQCSALVWGLLSFQVLACTDQANQGATLKATTHDRLAGAEGVVWLERKLTAGDGADGDDFGSAVALSSDLTAVGAPSHNDSAGAVYLFSRSGTNFSGWQKRTASDATPGSGFGTALAMSGDTVFIGAPNVESVYATTTAGEAKLNASDRSGRQYFGTAVAISGDTALVGAHGGGTVVGAAYVFVRSGETWVEQQKLTSLEAVPNDEFGSSVALSGETALVGAPRANSLQGSAYIFTRTGSTWSERQKLVASDTPQTGYFGKSVALSTDTALIGAFRDDLVGSAYVFTRSGSTWMERQKLTEQETTGYCFGIDVALQGATALIGTHCGAISAGTNSPGLVYLFTRSGSLWTEARRFMAADAMGPDWFGTSRSVALLGDTALIGASLGDGRVPSTGAAYAFVARSVDGEQCSDAEECLNGFCVDGLCCNRACDGACDACSIAAGSVADGVCGPVAAGSAGRPTCYPLACNGTDAVCTACADDGHCPSTSYCGADDTCKSRKALAESCDTSRGADCKVAGCRACESGHCADGVCCDEACGDCSACLRSLTGENDGTCAPVPAGADPNEACEADGDYPTSCGADGDCDGRGACRAYASQGTACGDTTCDEADDTVSGFVCDGEGDCEEDSVSCAPFACAGDECADGCSDDSDCAGAAYCLASVCTDKRGAGRTCEEERECASGHCVDGVCCNSACEGQCEACNETDTEGTCTQVLGSPRGERPACPEALACRGGECTADVMCSQDGLSVLGDGETIDCSPFRCRGASCIPSCESGSDCAPGARCSSDGECVAAGAADAPAEDSGCGCRTLNAPRTNNQNPWPEGLIVVAALGAGFLRRRTFRHKLQRI